RAQDGRLGEEVEEGRALDGAARGADGILERGIGEQHGAVAANHGHERGQQVEGLEALGGREGLVQALILRPSWPNSPKRWSAGPANGRVRAAGRRCPVRCARSKTSVPPPGP